MIHPLNVRMRIVEFRNGSLFNFFELAATPRQGKARQGGVHPAQNEEGLIVDRASSLHIFLKSAALNNE